MDLAAMDRRIEELETLKNNPGTYPTEVYARIVGYYRSLSNWNVGKSREYQERLVYNNPELNGFKGLRKGVEMDNLSVHLVTKEHCPRCPAMKQALMMNVDEYMEHDAGTDEGFEFAKKYSISSTPTVLVLLGNGNEARRITDPNDIGLVAGLVR